MGILTSFRNRVRAKKAADQIAPLLMPCFVHFLSPAGELDTKMRSDEFLLSYMYGVFGFGIEAAGITDNSQIGFTLWECFDRFFPGAGRQSLDFCNLRLESKDEKFLRGIARGWEEMQEACQSEGQSTFTSLLKHPVRYYSS